MWYILEDMLSEEEKKKKKKNNKKKRERERERERASHLAGRQTYTYMQHRLSYHPVVNNLS